MSLWSRWKSLLKGSPSSSTLPSAPSAGEDDESAAKVDVVVRRDEETERAARLRIDQVERALRAAGQREGEASSAEPPWARGKNRPGRLPSGPQRPHDAAFVLTVVLGSELPADAAALSARLHSAVWPQPSVRLIPLVRNGILEAGFAAEVLCGAQRAFLVYRQTPYEPGGGCGHVGLFIGGPGTRPGAKEAAEPGRLTEEERLLPALACSLLSSLPDALGLVQNREGRAWKTRDSYLDEHRPSAAAPEPS